MKKQKENTFWTADSFFCCILMWVQCELSFYSGFRCHNNTTSQHFFSPLGCLVLSHSTCPLSRKVVFVLRTAADDAVSMTQKASDQNFPTPVAFFVCYFNQICLLCSLVTFLKDALHCHCCCCTPAAFPLTFSKMSSFYLCEKKTWRASWVWLLLMVCGAAVWWTLCMLTWHWTLLRVLKRFIFFITLFYLSWTWV